MKVEEHFIKILAQDAGAKYYRTDLHIHTPSSADQKYKFPQKDARADIEKGYEKAREIAGQILDKLVEEGISVAAFTDHNSPGYVDNQDFSSKSWYELVKEVYDRRRADGSDYPDLLLLPGVEITTDRIHILGIFDDEDKFAVFKIASLLRSVDIRENEFGEVHGVFGTKSIWEVADAIDELGGICIPAHINQKNMRSLLGQYEPPDMEIERLVQHRAIHVFGVVPTKTPWPDHRSYQSILENMDPRRKRTRSGYHAWMVEKRKQVPQHLPALGYMMNSDAHSIPKIGERFSWVKMDDLSFRSLASALRNPSYSIHDNHVKPASGARSYVLGVSIEGGFASGLCMRFNEHFNCIVAGPNTGKTTLMRVIQDTFESKRLGIRVREELEAAINTIADGLWQEIKGADAFSEPGFKKLPEEVRQGIGATLLETHGLPWSIFVFFSRAQEDGSKVIYAAERRRLKGVEKLDGNEDRFRFYQSDPQPADLDRIDEVHFSKIGQQSFRNELAGLGFYFGRIGLGDEKDNFPGARNLLDKHLLHIMDDYDSTQRRLFLLCRRLEKAAEQAPPDTDAIATHAAGVGQLLERLYTLRTEFAKDFNKPEQERALRIAFHKGRWQEVVADTPKPEEIPDYVHRIRQYLYGQNYYDLLELTFYQKKKRDGSWEEIPFSQLTPAHQSLMALRLLLNSSSRMESVFIDCPEQWLNNETLVEFCDMRRSREDQLIFFTQNPNIAVLGNADQTIILDVVRGRTKDVATGGLGDHGVAEEVIRLLEGGSKAFQRKLLRYQADLRHHGLRVELQRPEKE